MKIHSEPPAKDVLIVKPKDATLNDGVKSKYEIWVTTPTKIGEVSEVKGRRFRCGNLDFPSVNAAKIYLLEQAGEKELIAIHRHVLHAVVTGLHVVKNCNWTRFCELRKIDEAEFLSKPHERYTLTFAEAAEIGFEVPWTRGGEG